MRYNSRRDDETRFEYLKRRVPRVDSEVKLVAAFGASVLATTGVILVGGMLNQKDGSRADKGTARVGKCVSTAGRLAIRDPKQSPNTAVGERLPQGSGVYLDRIFLDSAVDRLANAAPRSVGNGDARTTFSNSNNRVLKLINAEYNVFYTQTDGISTDETFEITNPETKLDDDSEVFCVQGDQVYLTPQAADAVVAMESVGIDVNPQLSAAIK